MTTLFAKTSLLAIGLLVFSLGGCSAEPVSEDTSTSEDAIGGVGGGVGRGTPRPEERWVTVRSESKSLSPSTTVANIELPALRSGHPQLGGTAALFGEIVGFDQASNDLLFYRYTGDIHFPGQDATA